MPKIDKQSLTQRPINGKTVVRGSAEPGSTVQLLLDGVEVHSQVAAPDGEWSASVVLPKAGSFILTVESSLPDSQELIGSEKLVVDAPNMVVLESATSVPVQPTEVLATVVQATGTAAAERAAAGTSTATSATTAEPQPTSSSETAETVTGAAGPSKMPVSGRGTNWLAYFSSSLLLVLALVAVAYIERRKQDNA